MSPLKSTVLLVSAAALLAPASGIAAIHVDPDAPAGVQYGAPLDRARAEGGDGGTAGAPGSTEEAPLFGKGIEKAKAGKQAGGSDGSPTESAAGAASQVADSDGGSGEGPLLAVTAAVLVLGAAAGFGLRRRLATQ